MLIYNEYPWNRSSYSSINRKIIKRMMENVREAAIYYNLLWSDTIHLNHNNRFVQVGIDYSTDCHDFFMISKIYSREYLPIRSNHSPFYEVDRSEKLHHSQFRNGIYCIPLTFTSDFLYDPSNYEAYRYLTVGLYEKKMKVKLGLCGSYLEKYKVPSHMDKW